MTIEAVFIVYFSIKETQFHRDAGAWRGQYSRQWDPLLDYYTICVFLYFVNIDICVSSIIVIYPVCDVWLDAFFSVKKKKKKKKKKKIITHSGKQ